MDAARERKGRAATLQKVQITMSYVDIKQIIKYSLPPPRSHKLLLVKSSMGKVIAHLIILLMEITPKSLISLALY